MVPLGWPVVPEVKAISAISSAAVSTLAKPAGFAAIAASSVAPSPPVPSGVKYLTSLSRGDSLWVCWASSARARSHRQWSMRAFSTMKESSRARSSGMVATQTPPALRIASQAAAIIGLLGPRSSTRLPGTRPISSTSTRAIASALALSSA